MVKCQDCKKEMLSPSGASGCDHPFVTIGGRSYRRDTQYYDVNKNVTIVEL